MISTFIGNFSPLRHRNLRVYLGGQTISLIGTWLQVTAQSWVVWTLTGSTVALGGVWALSTLPILVISPWSGVWADRFDRRRILVFTQIGAMLLAFVMAYLVQAGLVRLWHVYLISLLLGSLSAIDFPAQQAFIGDLSGMGDVRKGVSLNNMIFQVSRILGPAMGGLVLSSLGAAAAFWMNGFSFLVVLASLLVVRSQQIHITQQSSPLRQFVDAVKFVRSRPRIQDLLVFVTLITFFGLAIVANVLPAVADEALKGNAATLSALMAASGAGAFVGTLLLVPYLQSLSKPGLVVVGATIWTGVWYVIFSLTRSLFAASMYLFLVSLGPPIVVTVSMGLTQFLAPPDMRARLMSLFILLSFGPQPFAAILLGYIAQALTTPIAILLYGAFLVAGALVVLLLRPGLRHWTLPQPPTLPANREARIQGKHA